MKSKETQTWRVIKYLDSLTRKELETISKSDIALKLELTLDNVGISLQRYQLANKIDSQSYKRIVFEYLATLTKEEFKNMSYIKLSKKLSLNKNTTSAYLTEFNRRKTSIERKPLIRLVFEYLVELTEEELKNMSNTKLSKKLNINKNTAHSYLSQFRRLKTSNERKSLIKLAFEYLAKLTEEELKNMSNIKLSKKLNIKKYTAGAYLTKFRRLRTANEKKNCSVFLWKGA